MRSIIVPAGLIAALTLITNLLGFTRELFFAKAFGATKEADAFVAAFSIVATCFLILAGGALQGAFMPRYQRALVQDRAELAKGLWNASLIGVAAFSATVSASAFFYSEKIISWVLPGFDEASTALTAQVLKWLTPMIFFSSLGALLQSVLHAHRLFILPALVPTINNLFVIFVLLVFVPSYGLMALSYGTMTGAALWLLLVPSVIHSLPSKRGTIDRASLSDLWRALLPLIILLVVDQIAALLQKTLVSGLETGSISVLSYAARLQGLPVGIFAGALSAAIFPALVEATAKGDRGSFEERFLFGLGGIAFLLVPATAFLITYSELIVKVLLERGAFSAEATLRTAAALELYSAGLVAQGLIVYINKVYFSLGNTKTPMIVGIITAIFHVFLCWVAVTNIGYLGIAAGTAAYAILYLVVLLLFLRAHIASPILSVARATWRPTAASIFMVGVAHASPFRSSVEGLMLALGFCGIAYIAASVLLGGPIWKETRQRLRTIFR